MNIEPHHTGRIEKIYCIGQKSKHRKLETESAKKGIMSAQKACNTHGGTYMKGQFLNIDFPISKGHEKKVQRIQPQRDGDHSIDDSPLLCMILVSHAQTQQNSNCKEYSNKANMPNVKAPKNNASGFVRQ